MISSESSSVIGAFTFKMAGLQLLITGVVCYSEIDKFDACVPAGTYKVLGKVSKMYHVGYRTNLEIEYSSV